MTVHNEMGPGHLEAVYHECLEIEFGLRKIPFISKPRLSLYFKTFKLKKYYEPDFRVFGDIILEIKASKMLTQKGKLLPLVKYLLNQPVETEKASIPDWRERLFLYHGHDPLICEICGFLLLLR